MILVGIYLLLLFVAPQLWIEPFVGWRVDYFIYPVWILYVAATGRLPQLVRFRWQDWFFLAFVLWIIATIAVNGLRDNSTMIMTNYAKWFLLYRLTVVSLPDIAYVQHAAKLLVFFALVLAWEGIDHVHSDTELGWAGQSFGWVDQAAAELGLDKRTRWINIFDGPGVFCVVYTIALPFLLQYLGFPFRWGVRVVAAMLLVPLLVAIYYTGSRGGWLTTIALFGLVLVTRIGISLPRLAAGGLLCIPLAMLSPRYLTSTRDASRSAQHRVEMWAEGIEMVQFNPVFGIGKGNFVRYTRKLIAHNSAVEIMGETGFPGLFLWLGVIYMGMKNIYLYVTVATDPVHRSYAQALALSIAGYLISAMFVTLEYETFYFLLGMSAAVGTELEEPAPFARYDALIIGAIMAMFFVPLKAFVMLYF